DRRARGWMQARGRRVVASGANPRNLEPRDGIEPPSLGYKPSASPAMLARRSGPEEHSRLPGPDSFRHFEPATTFEEPASSLKPTCSAIELSLRAARGH